MTRLYDFGANTRNVSANERIALAWPVAVWTCYIPESEMQELNILEHLILQLVNKDYVDVKAILCRQVGLNNDLVEAAIEACNDKGYFDRRFKELKLSADGARVLGKVDNPYRADLEASQKNKKIYMIQELVTKNVVPVFDIDSLPEFYTEDDKVINITYDKYDRKKPKSASIKTALRYWARLCNNSRLGILSGSNNIIMTEPPEQESTLDDFIPFEDEIAWEDVSEETDTNEIITLADKEDLEQAEKKETQVSNLTFLDDTPDIYMAKAYIAINRNDPEAAIIVSPFGDRLDDWFRTVVNRLRACDSSFEDDIQLFLMEKRDELKDVIAFANNLNIELFNKFPFISNVKDFADLKRAIEALVRTKERIISGEDETHNFTENRATALQIALRHIIDCHQDLLQPNMTFKDYDLAIRGLVNSYGFDEELIRNYLDSMNAVYNNMKSCKVGTGHITGYSALFLIDAWNNRDGKSMDLLKAIPEFADIIFDITRPRNTSTHGNKGKNGKEGYAEMYVSKDEAIKSYNDFDVLITALYSRFMEGV